MNKIMLAYDLCGEDKNYDGLIKRINQYPVHLKINKSTWLIKTCYSCSEVRDELQKLTDNNDMLFVAKLTGEAAWTKVESNSSLIKKELESDD